MRPNVYRASITREQFLFSETRIIARLINQGYTQEEIYVQILRDNLFQLPTEKSVRSIFSGIYKRLANCPPSLILLIANGTNAAAKQGSLYAFMMYNRIVWDFMVDVIGEKYTVQNFEFSKSDVSRFLLTFQTIDETRGWSDSTIAKIKTILIKTLVDVGFLDTINSTELNYFCIDNDLLNCIIENGDYSILPCFNYIN